MPGTVHRHRQNLSLAAITARVYSLLNNVFVGVALQIASSLSKCFHHPCHVYV